MPKPLTLDKPFPTTEGISEDCVTLGIILPAYATPNGELNAVLQYFYHYFAFDKKGRSEDAASIESIAISEMLHLELLGKTITALGARPLYCRNPPTAFDFYSAKFVSYSCNLKNMIEDDILSERRAIAGYERMLKRLKNEQVKNIISRISEDEKLHLARFKQILSSLNN